MTMIDILKQNPQIKHGNIAIAFTPDEEVGGGDRISLISKAGERSSLTPSMASSSATFERNVVRTYGDRDISRPESRIPGTAKGIMINSMYAAGDFLGNFPADVPNRPETTEGRVGFMHPYSSAMDEETSTIKILLRDFDINGLAAKETRSKRSSPKRKENTRT